MALLVAREKIHHIDKSNAADGVTAAHLAAELIRPIPQNEDDEIEENAEYAPFLIELINSGADLATLNNDNISVFDIMSQFSLALQKHIFFSIKNPATRSKLLTLYDMALKMQSSVDENGEPGSPSPELIAFYTLLSGTTSLQDRVIAHLEYDDTAIISNWYSKTERVGATLVKNAAHTSKIKNILQAEREQASSQEGVVIPIIEESMEDDYTVKENHYVVKKSDRPFFSDVNILIGNKLTNYASRLREGVKELAEQDAQHIEVLTQLDTDLKEINTDSINIPLPATTSELISQDKLTISSLIADIQDYLDDMNQRPQTSNTIRNVCQAIACVSYVGITIGTTICGLRAHQYWDAYHIEDAKGWGSMSVDMIWSDYEAASNYSVGAGFLAGLGFLGVGAMHFTANKFLTNYPISISANNEPTWKEIIQLFKYEIMDKIKILRELEQDDGQSHSPVNQAEFTDLANITARLQDKQTIQDTIILFTDLITALETLRTCINKNNKPLSLLFTAAPKPAGYIDLEEAPSMSITEMNQEDSEEEDEITPLLRVNRGGYGSVR